MEAKMLCHTCQRAMQVPISIVTVDLDALEISVTCPTCGDRSRGGITEEQGMLLIAKGAQVKEKPKHPEVIPAPDLPPFTLDDLIDFHEELEAMTWLT